MESIENILKSIRPEFNFHGVTDYFAKGMLDSFDLTTLVSTLEGQHQITIDGADIVPENFKNAEAIQRLLNKYGVRF